MQYTTIVLSALSAAAALPGAHKARHHHRRHAEAEANYDVSNVNWGEALANVNWADVFGKTQTTTSVNAVPQVLTTTVAVAAANTPAAVVSQAVGNVAKNAISEVVTGSRPQVTTVAPVATTATPVSVPSSTPVSANGDEYTVTVVNNCAYTIWQAGWQTNTNGALISDDVKGNQMAAGASLSLPISKAALGVQIWARTGCHGTGSSFSCDVGDCQGLKCTSIIWQGGPIMAEFGSGLNTDVYNTGITAYDISAIPGNNVGAKIVPSKSSCETKYCPVSGCSHDQAWLSADDMSLGSPADTTCSNDTNFTVTFCPA